MKNTSKVVIPRKTDVFFELWKNILKKHEEDGTESPLHSINMADALAKYQIALQKHNDAERYNREAKIATEQSNNLLGIGYPHMSTLQDTVLYFVTSSRDILLGVYKGEEPALGKWGFEVNENKRGGYRIPIPYRKAQSLIELAQKAVDKHTADGANSPLGRLDMSRFADLLSQARTWQGKSKHLHKLKEIAYKERNNALGRGKNFNSSIPGTLQYYVRAVRNILLGIFRGEEPALGKWGFEVNSNPRRKKSPVQEGE